METVLPELLVRADSAARYAMTQALVGMNGRTVLRKGACLHGLSARLHCQPLDPNPRPPHSAAVPAAQAVFQFPNARIRAVGIREVQDRQGRRSAARPD